MRIAVCALSAVLLSGCSWMGSGANHGNSYGYGYNGVYNGGHDGCMSNAQGASFANSNYGYSGGQGCAPGGAYGASQGGMGMHGMSQGGMHGSAHGLRGQHGVNAYGAGLQSSGMHAGGHGMHAMRGMGSSGHHMQGQQAITTLSQAAPYGTATGGVTSGMSVQGGAVKTVQGAPIYVAQPYPAYYNAGGAYGGGYNYGGQYSYGGQYGYGGYGYGGSMPFGLELGVGTDLSLDGDVFPGEVAKPFLGGPGNVSDLDPIAYGDAFDNAKVVDLAATYDIDQNTTLLGRVGYSKADGNNLLIGTVDDGLGTTEDLYAEFSDLEQYTVEGGFRHYMGQPTGFRPYVGATAGFTKTEDVTITQSSDTLVDPAVFQQTYIDGGWSPTAAGMIGAEVAVGGKAALGVETGIRWTDNLDTNFPSDDRWTVPVRLRGRVSF